MTQPGSVEPAAPGWWARTGRVGTTESEIEFDSSAAGETPIIRYLRQPMIANPKVGSMALRHNFPRKPQASRRRTPPVFDSIGTEKHANIGAGASGTYTIAHTIGVDATALIVVCNLWTPGYVNTRMTATVGSQNFTLTDYTMNYNNDGSLGGCLYLLTLLNPPTGAQTITCNLTSGSGASNYVSSNSFAYTGVGGFGTVTKGNVGTGTPSLAVPATPGDLIFNAWGDYTTNHASYNQTSRWARTWTAGTGFSTIVGEAAAATASTTFSTAQVATTHCIMGLPLQSTT